MTFTPALEGNEGTNATAGVGAKSRCLPCLPAWEHGFGPCSALALVGQNPQLVSCGVLRQPGKIFLLMTRAKPREVRQLCAAAPRSALGAALPRLLEGLESKQIQDVLVPLLNDGGLRGTLVELLQVVTPGVMVEVLSHAPASKLQIVLRAPASKLSSIISGIRTNCISTVLLPVLREPDSLLKNTLVPIIEHIRYPERLAAVVNQVEADVLLWLLRGVDACAIPNTSSEARKLAAVLDALAPEDVEPNGAAILLLKDLTDHRGLVRDKVLPLLLCSEPGTIAKLVSGIRAGQLLKILRRVEVKNLLPLLKNTNSDLVVKLFNGPLEDSVATVTGNLAGHLATVMRRHETVAFSVQKVTNSLNDTITEYENARSKANVKFKGIIDKGKLERGASTDDGYQFGDVTRGLLSRHSVGRDILQMAFRLNSKETLDEAEAAVGAKSALPELPVSLESDGGSSGGASPSRSSKPTSPMPSFFSPSIGIRADRRRASLPAAAEHSSNTL